MRNIIAPKGLRTPVYDFGMGFKIRRCKYKKGDIRAWKTACPPLSREYGERLDPKTKSVPSKKEEKKNRIIV